MVSVGHADLLQHPLICLVQRFRQFFKRSPDTLWEAMLQHFQLTENPSEPVKESVSVTGILTRSYIPSALSVSVSITSFLSLSLHLLIAVSESA